LDLSSVPSWLTEILKQFPALVLCGLTAEWVARKLGKRYREELDHLRSQHAATIEDVRAQHGQMFNTIRAQHDKHVADLNNVHADHLKSKDAEIMRLVQSHEQVQKDRDRLLNRLHREEKS
jgi:hypothetical protein